MADIKQEVEHVKCSRCKCWRLPEHFLNATGRKLKTCQVCRDRKKKNNRKNRCEHNRQKSQCKECGGVSICKHNKMKTTCKVCGGSQICEHGKRKQNCKVCGGSAICVHGKFKQYCNLCGGKQICEHNINKSHCKLCGGSQICEHNKIRSYCKDCGGGGICKHDKKRSRCKKCNNPVKITIRNWLSDSMYKDMKCNRYDANNFIDKCFLKMLVENQTTCIYCDCELQFVEYTKNLATIERKDNSIGHTKANCTIACHRCNKKRAAKYSFEEFKTKMSKN